MAWLELLGGAGAGAVAGGVVSVLAASRIAEGGERGRLREEARQRIVARTLAFRSYVAMERGKQTHSNMEPDYLSRDEALRFARSVEVDLRSLRNGLQRQVRQHLVGLVGPTNARIAHHTAPLSEQELATKSEVVMFMEIGTTLTEAQISDHGLIGKARDASPDGDEVPGVVAELDALAKTLGG